MVIELNNVVDPQLNKSKHDFTGQAILNNCKDKGRKGLHFSQQKGKIRKNSHIDIFIRHHLGIACADVG